jgi:hypothetical protein
MAWQVSTAVPLVFLDDGVVIIFNLDGGLGGFTHRPANHLEPHGGTVTPPITWSDSDTMDSWLDTIKYGARTNAHITCVYDDAIAYSYKGWEATYTGQQTAGATYAFAHVYAVMPGSNNYNWALPATSTPATSPGKTPTPTPMPVKGR